MKMSDAEIIKAFTICANQGACKDCPLGDLGGVERCMHTLLLNALDLINRQQAEIERLKSLVLEFMDCVSKWSAKHDNDLSDEINKIPVMDKCRGKVKEIKSEAYKEFAERLKSRVYKGGVHPTVDDEFITEIDNLLKEMGCE